MPQMTHFAHRVLISAGCQHFLLFLLISVDILAISPCCFSANIQASLLEHSESSTTKASFTQLVTGFSFCIPQMTGFPLTVNGLINYISHNKNLTLGQEKNGIFSTNTLIHIWLWVWMLHLQLKSRSECVYAYLPQCNKSTKCNSYTSWNYGLHNRWLWCLLIFVSN